MAALSELGEAALAYAEQGWYTFPCIPYEKRPIIPDMFNQSSIDPEQIKAWWTEYPKANIGLDCGKSGLVAIDVDPKHPQAPKVIEGLKVLSGGAKAWQTWKSKTPSGGAHYVFRMETSTTTSGELRTGAARFGSAGIDVRARGGYIVLPPSKLATGAYSLDSTARPLPIPARLLSPSKVERDIHGRTELEATLEDGQLIGFGARDNFLTAVSGRLRRIGFEPTEIIGLLRETYALRCEQKPAFTDDDFIRLANTATRWRIEENPFDNILREEISGEWNDRDESLAINAATFLEESEDEKNWIVEGMLQSTTLNMLSGGPKSGKSTLARRLAIDVAFGLPFLGRFITQPSRVLYYSLQENRAHLRYWLQKTLDSMNVVPLHELPIDFIFRLGKRGTHAAAGLRERCSVHHYGLVIVDMFGRFSNVRSLDDYVETEAACDALKEVADEFGTCILFLHHDRKQAGGFEGAIGSQAIRGAVYTTAKTWKDNGRYYLATEQRDGDDLRDAVITLDKNTNAMRTAGNRITVAVADYAELQAKIASVLETNPKTTNKQVHKTVGGRSVIVNQIIKSIRDAKRSD